MLTYIINNEKINIIDSYNEMNLEQMIGLKSVVAPKDENDLAAFINILKILCTDKSKSYLLDDVTISKLYEMVEGLLFMQEPLNKVKYTEGNIFEINKKKYLLQESVTDMNKLTAGEFISIKTLESMWLKKELSEIDYIAMKMAILIRPAIPTYIEEFNKEIYVISKFESSEVEMRAEFFKKHMPAQIVDMICGFFLLMKNS